MHGLKARLFDADGFGSRQATKKFLDWVETYDPDIIHLHNLHGYYINIPLLIRYISEHNKRVIWTLHDTWAFSGHSGTCDFADCEKWVDGCDNCPLTKGYPKSYSDRSKYNCERKKQLFTSLKKLTVITPSKWLASLVKRSFLKDATVISIFDGIDMAQFHRRKSD